MSAWRPLYFPLSRCFGCNTSRDDVEGETVARGCGHALRTEIQGPENVDEIVGWRASDREPDRLACVVSSTRRLRAWDEHGMSQCPSSGVGSEQQPEWRAPECGGIEPGSTEPCSQCLCCTDGDIRPSRLCLQTVCDPATIRSAVDPGLRVAGPVKRTCRPQCPRRRSPTTVPAVMVSTIDARRPRSACSHRCRPSIRRDVAASRNRRAPRIGRVLLDGRNCR